MRLLKQILSLVPSRLPVGVSEFETWANSIIELSGEFADRDSMNFALATMVMHLGPQRSTVSKNYFVRSLRKAAANQVAGQVFQDIKERQKQAEEKRKQDEAALNEQSQEVQTHNP